MKKLITMTLAAAMALSFVACAASSNAETSVPSTGSSTQSATTAATTESQQAQTTAPDDAFQAIVLVDNKDITVKITGIDEDGLFGYTLNVYLENKTDKELMFTVDNVSVNGFMCDPFWASTVAAGMKANQQIRFSDSDFEKNGIEAVASIVMTLRAYDSKDWLAVDIFNDTFTVNP